MEKRKVRDSGSKYFAANKTVDSRGRGWNIELQCTLYGTTPKGQIQSPWLGDKVDYGCGYIQLLHRVPYTIFFFGFGLCSTSNGDNVFCFMSSLTLSPAHHGSICLQHVITIIYIVTVLSLLYFKKIQIKKKIVRHTGIQEFPDLNPCSKGGSYNAD